MKPIAVENPRSMHAGPKVAGEELGYRRDIEGLRAIAVLFVVLAHAGLSWLEGGFIGVDVFFVLSGYLISALLLQEFRRTGTISFAAFYTRRFKRLLPGLLFMLGVSSIAAAAFLAPVEQARQARSAAAAAAWISNLLFSFARIDYFGPEADTNLFLHTWSLGVEEQFYLVWPVFLLLLLGSTGNERRLITGLVITALSALLLSVVLTHTQPAWGFYLMPPRAWQFALGALTYLSGERLRNSDPGHPLTAALLRLLAPASVAGIASISGAAVILDDHTSYPGYWALLPSLGTALLLFVQSINPRVGVGPFLSSRPMEALGRVSYSWYLWHWPVLLLGESLLPPGYMTVTLLVLLSLATAAFSYRCIERPIRNSPYLAGRNGLVLAMSAVLISGAVVLAYLSGEFAHQWMSSPAHQRYEAVRRDLPVLYSANCDDWFYSADVKLCGFGNPDARRKVLVFGDSIGQQWYPAIEAAYQKRGWAVLVLTKSACPIVDQPFFYSRIGRDYVECTIWRREALKTVSSVKPDVVLIGSSSSYPFSREEWTAGTVRILDQLRTATERTLIIQPSPALGMDGPSCLSRRDWRMRWGIETGCSRAVGSTEQLAISEALQEAARRFPDIELLDFNALICPGKRCEAEIDGQIVFRDAEHVSAGFVESLKEKIEAQLEAAGGFIGGSRQAAVHTVESPNPWR